MWWQHALPAGQRLCHSSSPYTSAPANQLASADCLFFTHFFLPAAFASLPCVQVVGNKYETYVKMMVVEGKEPAECLNELGLKRYCCRRMVLTHVDLIDKLLAYHSFQKREDTLPKK